jgi:hypothetical protein
MSAPPSHPCPRCHTPSAQPERLAQETASEARVVLRCHACRHRWSAMFAIDEAWPLLRQQLLRQSVWREPA